MFGVSPKMVDDVDGINFMAINGFSAHMNALSRYGICPVAGWIAEAERPKLITKWAWSTIPKWPSIETWRMAI